LWILRPFRLVNQNSCRPCQSIAAARSMAELPKATRDYVDFITRAVDVPAWLVSVGPRRSETIVLHQAFPAKV